MLDAKLSNHIETGEIIRPPRLIAAMRHGVLNGGKRLRPFLVVETARLFDADIETAQCVGLALEAIHCYSLIHDDLPAMDNDDLRRGKPTVHKAFDEATAILAGDALLTIAFDFLSDKKLELSAETRLELINGLARAAGLGGMVGGQMLDLEAETQKPDESGIITLQAMKTGALIRYACEAGAIIGNAMLEDRERLIEFGSAIGLAFQLADDVLDVTADTQALGKTAGKDIAANKATLVALHGVDWARRQLAGLMEQADSVLEPFGKKADILRATAKFVIERKS
ncbi:polyprenyl synthetase family protein [uncultured Bartonella sp.]|uniref:polyprenyl synthetase family protein n=1 Tax=uncultured Bartonella sp. TaxID=104108 RepID=UPI00343947BA